MRAACWPRAIRNSCAASPLDDLPWLQSRLAPLRVSELRDTSAPREDQADDAAVWSHLGIGSVLMIGYFIKGRAAGLLGIANARPRDNWDVQLHLLMKLVGSSLATGLERIEIQRHLEDLEERNELAIYSANDGLWDFDTLEQSGLSVAALEGDARLR